MLCRVENSTDSLAWQITTAPGGWLRFVRKRLVEGEVMDDSKPHPVVYLRVTKGADGKPGVRDAVMIGGDPIRATSWRDIPFDLAGLFASASSDASAPPALGVVGNQLEGPAAGDFSLSDSLEALFADSTSASTLVDRVGASSGSLTELKAPTAGLTDEFLDQLAAAYRELAAAKRAPAPAIAEQTGRPVGTVHRWIAEARKRGYLPPAQRGRVG